MTQQDIWLALARDGKEAVHRTGEAYRFENGQLCNVRDENNRFVSSVTFISGGWAIRDRPPQRVKWDEALKAMKEGKTVRSLTTHLQKNKNTTFLWSEIEGEWEILE